MWWVCELAALRDAACVVGETHTFTVTTEEASYTSQFERLHYTTKASSLPAIPLYLMSPAAMKMGSLLSRLVMLSTENWEMLSQLLVWNSGSWDNRGGERTGERVSTQPTLLRYLIRVGGLLTPTSTCRSPMSSTDQASLSSS